MIEKGEKETINVEIERQGMTKIKERQKIVQISSRPKLKKWVFFFVSKFRCKQSPVMVGVSKQRWRHCKGRNKEKGRKNGCRRWLKWQRLGQNGVLGNAGFSTSSSESSSRETKLCYHWHGRDNKKRCMEAIFLWHFCGVLTDREKEE